MNMYRNAGGLRLRFLLSSLRGRTCTAGQHTEAEATLTEQLLTFPITSQPSNVSELRSQMSFRQPNTSES